MERFSVRSPDGTNIACYRWEPAEGPKAEVLLVHGLAEHAGRYGHVAAALTRAGYRVFGLDLRGHGHSGGKRGHVRCWEDYVDDLRAVVREIDAPYALLGHSMGGLVVLDHLRDGEAWAVVTSAPLLGVALEAPRWKLATANFLSGWWPSLSLGNEIDTNLICTDRTVVDEYVADPLIYSTITARWYTELLEAISRVNRAAPTYDIPLFCAWGKRDRLVSTEATEDFCKRYGAPVHTMGCDGCFHEILNEPAKYEILDQIVAWLDARLAEQPAPA
ncbi:MAG: lysophospholipase [Deltaproteobacteria bacterium]|nr:lysophospholipase [Deltaproteobacteria bacterium]